MPLKIQRAALIEGWDRIRAFELQCRDGSGWKTIFAGTTIGETFSRKFKPVTSSTFRLDVSDATDGPTIWEIKLK